jgi:RNA polymerase sigma-70 factor, ECF subfamily
MVSVAFRIVKCPHLAEDIAQESLLKAHENFHQFRSESNLRTWLHSIVRNTAFNSLRGSKRVFVDLNFDLLPAPETEEIEFQNHKDMLLDAINQLSHRQKLAVMLKCYRGLSFKEMAGVMGCKYDTAKANYRLGIIRLRTLILTEEDL